MPSHNKLDPTTFIGQKFNRLTIIEYVGKTDTRTHRVMVECECGVIKEATYNNLKSGVLKSCGCLVREHCAKGSSRKHGLYKHPLFRIWHGMSHRCYSGLYPAYSDVEVCDEWRNDIMTFFNWAIANGWEEGLELDKDKLAPTQTGKLYGPEYCSFITHVENCRHRGNTVIIEYNGEVKSLPEWAVTLNIEYALLIQRYSRGWSPARMFETPIKQAQIVEYNGKSKSLSEWATSLGVKYKSLLARINDGWSIEKTLSTPVKKYCKKAS